MSSRFARRVLLAFASIALASTSAAAADVGSRQVLDSVKAYTPTTVLEMLFNAGSRPPDFENSGIAGTAISTCTLTATRGLFCLDGDAVRRWPNPADPASEVPAFSCLAALTTTPRRGEACTGLAADVNGNLWIAGARNNAHALVKLLEGAGTCPAGSRAVPGSPYCATDSYSGRPPIADLAAVDGEQAELFRPCPGCAPQAGLLALESRKDVIFYPDPAVAAPVTVVADRAWGLRSRETLQNVALLQVPDGTSAYNFILVTTSSGRILARNTAGGTTQVVFEIVGERREAAAAPNKQCFGLQPLSSSSAPSALFDLRASNTSGTVYVSDREFCEVLALRPQLTANPDPALPTLRLVNIAVPGGTTDFTLSTDSTLYASTPTVGTFPPIGVTVADGVTVDLKDCTSATCPLVESANPATPAAAISAVRLQEGSKSGVTIFQVVGLPDCRYRNAPGFDPALKATCETLRDQVIVRTTSGPNKDHPATQMLNVKPLLPDSIQRQFRGEIPPVGKPLLISREYRGQPDRQYLIDAFFAVAEPGVRFNGTFLFAFDVPLLDDPAGVSGLNRRCKPTDGGRSLQDWDVMTRVSETVPSVGGNFVDTITNVDCINPSMSEEVSFSLLPYTLELTPDTYDPHRDRVTEQNDALFARFVQKLYGDLESIRATYACPASPATPLLPASTCNTLKGIWQAGLFKLDVCVAKAFDYYASSSDRAFWCNAFLGKLDEYLAAVPTSTPVADEANRTGELRARVNALKHVFTTRFVPSIPAKGFCREKRPASDLCRPVPWPAFSLN